MARKNTVNLDLNGVEMIMSERGRQIEIKGYDEDHDDQHDSGELAMAAACYAAPDRIYVLSRSDEEGVSFDDPWPWDEDDDMRRTDTGKILPNTGTPATSTEDRIDQLAKAGALIAAEIDRLRRTLETE